MGDDLVTSVAAAGSGAPGDEERVLAAYNLASEGTLSGRMGIKIIEASPDRIVGTMPVAGNTQPYGLLHGGASCVLAETSGSLAAALHAGLGPRAEPRRASPGSRRAHTTRRRAAGRMAACCPRRASCPRSGPGRPR